MNHKERVKIRNEIDRLERAQRQNYFDDQAGMIKALKWVLEVCS